MFHIRNDTGCQSNSFLDLAHPYFLSTASEGVCKSPTGDAAENHNERRGYSGAKPSLEQPRCQSSFDRIGPELVQIHQAFPDLLDVSAHQSESSRITGSGQLYFCGLSVDASSKGSSEHTQSSFVEIPVKGS